MTRSYEAMSGIVDTKRRRVATGLTAKIAAASMLLAGCSPEVNNRPVQASPIVKAAEQDAPMLTSVQRPPFTAVYYQPRRSNIRTPDTYTLPTGVYTMLAEPGEP